MPDSAGGAIALATWIGAAANVLVASVAAFQERIRRAIFRPNLELELHSGRPDCQRIDIPVMPNGVASAFYLRLRVQNRGRATAQHVEVYVAQLEEWRDNQFRHCAWFLPMALAFTHTGSPFASLISPGIFKHCELGRVAEPSERPRHFPEDHLSDAAGAVTLRLFLEVHPVNARDVLKNGRYRLTLVLAAKDVGASRWHLDVTVPFQWIEDEQLMLRDGLKMAISRASS